MTDIEYKYYLIELIPRVFCGIIFLFQGYDKLFKVKIQGVVEAFLFETQHRYVPKFLLQGWQFLPRMLSLLVALF